MPLIPLAGMQKIAADIKGQQGIVDEVELRILEDGTAELHDSNYAEPGSHVNPDPQIIQPFRVDGIDEDLYRIVGFIFYLADASKT